MEEDAEAEADPATDCLAGDAACDAALAARPCSANRMALTTCSMCRVRETRFGENAGGGAAAAGADKEEEEEVAVALVRTGDPSARTAATRPAAMRSWCAAHAASAAIAISPSAVAAAMAADGSASTSASVFASKWLDKAEAVVDEADSE